MLKKYILIWFDGKTGSSGIGLGQDNGNMLEMTSMHIGSDSSIEVYDRRNGKIYGIISDDGKLGLEERSANLRLLDDARLLPDGNLLTLPLNSEISYKILDCNNETIDSLSYFPPNPDGISDFTHQLACTGTLALNPDGKNFVV